MQSRPKRFRALRDLLVPSLIEQAYQGMLQIYKPGMIEAHDENIAVSCETSLIGLREVQMIRARKRFISCYKIAVPFTIVIKECNMNDLFQEGVSARTIASTSKSDKINGDSTLFIYLVDYWVTDQGEVWKEQDKNIWQHVTNIPVDLMEKALLIGQLDLLYSKRPI